ncbi:MAG: flagellar hook-associated protein FlgL [Candidatus Polarisedimenticolia bacterium]|nr:flagellar hook-associated protein FlgL [bacterium]
MRVSQMFSQQVYLRTLKQTKSDLDATLAQLSSGKRVQYASDDPEAAKELLQLADETQQLTLRKNGISQARPWLQNTEQALTNLSTTLQSALTYGLQGSSSTMQQAERDALAEQIAGLRSQVNGLTNLQVAGHYIFSGTLTDTAPYDAAGVYQGNETQIQIPVDDGTTPINLPGDQVFGNSSSGPLKLLGDLETALRSGTAADVQGLLDPLRAAISKNAATLARVGNYRKQLEDADARIDDRMLEVKSRANDIGSADMAQTVSDVAKYTQGHEATLAAGARLYGSTFFDYLS